MNDLRLKIGDCVNLEVEYSIINRVRNISGKVLEIYWNPYISDYVYKFQIDRHIIMINDNKVKKIKPIICMI